MASHLGYDIDKVTIRRNAYYPKSYGEIEASRKAALQVFGGSRPLPMTIVGSVDVSEMAYVVSSSDRNPVTTVVRTEAARPNEND